LDWSGKRKIKEHVLEAYEAGMSKLKMLEMVELTVPLKEVCSAVFGEALEIGRIRCGNL